jgi:hypothetical protein
MIGYLVDWWKRKRKINGGEMEEMRRAKEGLWW